MAVKMTRYAVHHDRRYVALDQRAHITYKIICYIRAVFCYPFAGNKFFVIGNLMHILYFSSALIRVVGQSFEPTIFPESPSSAALTAAPPT